MYLNARSPLQGELMAALGAVEEDMDFLEPVPSQIGGDIATQYASWPGGGDVSKNFLRRYFERVRC